jgi:hypothetical protein
MVGGAPNVFHKADELGQELLNFEDSRSSGEWIKSSLSIEEAHVVVDLIFQRLGTPEESRAPKGWSISRPLITGDMWHHIPRSRDFLL